MPDEPQTAESRRPTALKGFTIEFGDDFGRNFYVPIINLVLRGEWSQARFANRKNADGTEIGSSSLGEKMSPMPEIPGQHLRLEPRTRAVSVSDPLEKKPTLWERIQRVMRNAMLLTSDGKGKLNAPTTVTLPVDEFKTLARDVRRFLDGAMAKVVDGVAWEMSEIDALPGRYLYDPSFEGRKPRYEDQLEGWMQKLEQVA